MATLKLEQPAPWYRRYALMVGLGAGAAIGAGIGLAIGQSRRTPDEDKARTEGFRDGERVGFNTGLRTAGQFVAQMHPAPAPAAVTYLNQGE